MIESAGFVIIDFSGKESRVLCLRNEWGQWDFPKGRLQPEETLFDAAVRETREESQLDLSMGDFHPIDHEPFSIIYRSGQEAKRATYFFAERTSDTVPELLINPEIGKPEHVMWEWVKLSNLHFKMPKRLQGLVLIIESIANEPNV